MTTPEATSADSGPIHRVRITATELELDPGMVDHGDFFFEPQTFDLPKGYGIQIEIDGKLYACVMTPCGDYPVEIMYWREGGANALLSPTGVRP